MEDNYHFKINQKPPSDEQIARHMDFDALLKTHQERQAVPRRKPKVRRLVYWGTAVAAAIVLLVFALPFLNPIQKENINSNTYFAQRQAITPPLNAQNDLSDFASTTINANQGGIYEYESGSRLVIPSSAFVDDKGHLIEGDVTIYYREYVNTVDFFLAGIPLDYDNQLLEPNGMVEVFAQKDGQLISLAPGKSIHVELVGQMIVSYDDASPDYGIYQFDSIQRKWHYVTLDNIQVIEDIAVKTDDPVYQLFVHHQAAIAAINTKEKTATLAIENSIPAPIAPIKPQPRDKNRPTLELSFLKDVLDKKGVDKNLYMETIWQISENSPAYDERAFQVEWEDANIKNINDTEYELTLSNGNNTLRLIVNPVLTSNEFSQALTLYQSKLEAYKQALKDRETTLVEQKRALNNLYQTERQKQIKIYQKALSSMVNKGDAPFLIRKVINQFETTQLGIYACARTQPLQQETFIAEFSLENNAPFDPHIAFVHFTNTNIVQRILAQNGIPLHYSSGSGIEIWMIDDKGQLLSSDAFIPDSKTKSHNFVMKKKGQVANREEVQQFLKTL